MISDYPKPYPVQFRPQTWALFILRLLGWKVMFEGFPAQQGIAIAYPHTSNWDFFYAMLANCAAGMPVHFWGKASLFQIPLFGRLVHFLGGVPLDRSSASGSVGQVVELINAHKKNNSFFWFGLSPEGTRKFQNGWRSGFYHLTLQTDVPLLLIRMDYGKKEFRIDQFIHLSGDEIKDYERINQAYANVIGFHPNQACPIQPIKKNLQQGDGK